MQEHTPPYYSKGYLQKVFAIKVQKGLKAVFDFRWRSLNLTDYFRRHREAQEPLQPNAEPVL